MPPPPASPSWWTTTASSTLSPSGWSWMPPRTTLRSAPTSCTRGRSWCGLRPVTRPWAFFPIGLNFFGLRAATILSSLPGKWSLVRRWLLRSGWLVGGTLWGVAGQPQSTRSQIWTRVNCGISAWELHHRLWMALSNWAVSSGHLRPLPYRSHTYRL